MAKINLLSDDLINKIAAGEVIERPASVVKELVENSLDAGGSKIVVEVKDSGQKLIKVSDNGEGMSEEDARRSILRHATSKINSVDDLFNIKTLGFRGEALASIAAVSQLSLTTRQREEIEGFNFVVEGGDIISSGVAGAEQGTTIEVHNLFFNTPVRKKFLKTDAVELRHIVDIIIRYALANPDVSFKLIHEGHALVNSPAVEDSRSKISSLYGIGVAKEMLEVEYGNEDVIVTGFIAKPHQARNDKSQQVLFVNGRWVKNNDITKAVYDAYHSTLFVNKHPLFVLNLELDPEKIDVNVHPQKHEIKIEQTDLVYNAVFIAVKETLERNNLIPVLEFNFEQQFLPNTLRPERKTERTGEIEELEGREETGKNEGEAQSNAGRKIRRLSLFDLTEEEKNGWEKEENAEIKNDNDLTKENPDEENRTKKSRRAGKYLFEESTQTVFVDDDKHNKDNYDPKDEFLIETELGEKETRIEAAKSRIAEEYSLAEELPGTIKLPPMKILGQVNKTFFVAETPGGVLFIDQHVVQERVLYEKFMEELMNKKVSIQELLQGEVIDFSIVQRIIIEDNLDLLEKLGFRLEHLVKILLF
ncbi:MAG: DNA mismatch repair endonuclease MutL [Nanoarchaeota archaeon]